MAKKIFINPGHGGTDAGAVSLDQKYTEREIVKKIGDRVEKYLKATGKCEIRNEQINGLDEICNASNDYGADIFVSIHCNGADEKSKGIANGTESYYCEKGTGNITESKKLAEIIHKCIKKQIPQLNDRGVKTAHFKVIDTSRIQKCPISVLIETAFIDNNNDLNLLLTKEDDFAKAIAQGIAEYAELGDIPGAVGGSASGVPLYHQYDSRWATHPYNGKYILNSGCGPTSMAMVLAWYGKEVTPPDVADYFMAQHKNAVDGTDHSAFIDCGPHWGIEFKAAANAEEVKQVMLKGFPVIAAHPDGLFTTGGHFIVYAKLVDSDGLIINDPNCGPDKTKNHYPDDHVWSFKEVLADNNHDGGSFCAWYPITPHEGVEPFFKSESSGVNSNSSGGSDVIGTVLDAIGKLRQYKGYKVEGHGSWVKITALPEKKTYCEPIYPDLVTVEGTVPKWALDMAVAAMSSDSDTKTSDTTSTSDTTPTTVTKNNLTSDTVVTAVKNIYEKVPKQTTDEELQKEIDSRKADLSKQLEDKKITQEEYDKKVTELTKDKIKEEIVHDIKLKEIEDAGAKATDEKFFTDMVGIYGSHQEKKISDDEYKKQFIEPIVKFVQERTNTEAEEAVEEKVENANQQNSPAPSNPSSPNSPDTSSYSSPTGNPSSDEQLEKYADFIIAFILRCPHMEDFINAIRPISASQDEKNVKNLISITKKWLEQNKDNNYKWKIKLDNGGFDIYFYPTKNKNDCVHAYNFNTFEGEQDILIQYSYKYAEYGGKESSGWRSVTFDK